MNNHQTTSAAANEPLIADHALAIRLEKTEATANARFVDARGQADASSDATWINIAGAYAMFDGPDSPCTQTFGLGILGEPTEADFEQLEDFYFSRGTAVHHEVAPLASNATLSLLTERGYRPIEYTNVLCRRIGRDASLPTSRNASLKVRSASKDEAELWANVSAAGWSESVEFQQLIKDLARNYARTEGCTAMFACADDAMIATGVLSVVDRVALLAGASTIPSARNQGVQSALLASRLALAIDSGCDIAMMCALPGSPSQRNAQRNGFHIAYTRTKWKLEAR